jgi:CRISPR-associated protein Cmr2
MTAHLLALTVGPVQEFISAARRTRDLWFGSYLLSEISKAAAKAVRTNGGKLIFPAPANDADLDPDSHLNVANVIVAEIPESDPATVAQRAKEAARSRWREFADSVLAAQSDLVNRELWHDQVDDVIEFYAAWNPYTPHKYQTDRRTLMRLLAARKRCRDFAPAKGRAKIPKSSLDGLRESVLREERPKGARRRLRLSDGEQLDVVGLVKRSWAPKDGRRGYPSVARVAADSWLRRVAKSHSLDALKTACRELGSGVVYVLDTESGGHPQYAAFPFEGSAVFRSRHREFSRETELTDSELKPLVDALGKLTGACEEPSPYLAVLVADGDRMGQAIAQLGSPDEHRGFSQALASFAAQADGIVKTYSGVLVYAGGDDVLAFVPVDQCLACARELHDTFGSGLAEWSSKTHTGLTLSVGVAIAHFMEPLEDLRNYGHDAEQHAKRPRPEDCGQQDRDGFAVHLIKRGGGEIAVRANWSAALDKRLAELVELIAAKAVSNRVAYDLHELAAIYDCWKLPEDSIRDAIQHDALSVMRGKQPHGTGRMEKIEALIRDHAIGVDYLHGLANELLIAKELAAGTD